MPISKRVLSPVESAERDVFNSQLKVKQLTAAAEGKQIVHDAQTRVAQRLVNTFVNHDILIATMVAPMQWGKTGVMLELTRMLVNHTTNPLPAKSVYVICGMSDNDWRDQTKDRFPEVLAPNIMHRCELGDLIDSLEKVENALFIIDECHYGAQQDGLVDKFFTGIGLKSITEFQKRNVRIFQTSATPDNVLLEAKTWNQDDKPVYHYEIVPEYPDSYMSFERIDREGRMMASRPLYDGSGVTELENAIKSFKEPRWHIVRLPSGPRSKAKQVGVMKVVRELNERNGWPKPIEHFGKKRMDEKMLSTQPDVHTVIFIKGLLRAAKTLDDTHLGVVYETFGVNKSDSSEAQGLAGRICGHNKRSLDGPILFCNLGSIDRYTDLMRASFNYSLGDLEFKSATVKKRDQEMPVIRPSFCNPYAIGGIEVAEEIERPGVRKTPVSHLSEVFNTIEEARKWCKINALGGIRVRAKNAAGYYEAPVPKDGTIIHLVCSRDELDVRGVGLSKQSPKRLLPFYTDKDDRDCVKFIINYRKYE